MVLKKLISNSPINSITAAAFVVAVMSFLSRVLGLFRDRVLAGEFGAGEMLDMYYAAFRLPDFLYNLLVLGGLSAAFIPLFTEYLRKKDGNKEAFIFANTIIGIGFIILIPTVLIAILSAPYLIKMIIAPGFSVEQQHITTELTKIMFLSPLLLGLSGVMSQILQSYKRFFFYSLAPIFYNVGIIIGALFFTKYWGIHGLAWGVVLGAFLHLLVQLPGLKQTGYRLFPKINFHHEKLKPFVKLMIPRTFNLIVVQLNLVVITVIASFLKNGSISIFNFANNLQGFAIGIIGVSFAVAAFPTLAELKNKNDNKHFSESFAKTVNEILFFILPITVIIIALRAQIVRIILGTGVFVWEDTVLTFTTLGYFSISLFAQSLLPLMLRAFYALKNTTFPFISSIIAFVVNAVLGYVFAFHSTLGLPGLALAFSLASIVQLIILWIGLRLKQGYLNDQKIVDAGVKMLIASAVMIPFIQIIKSAVAITFGTDTFLAILLQGGGAAIVGMVVYLVMSWVLRSEELFVFVRAIQRRITPTKSIDIGAGREV